MLACCMFGRNIAPVLYLIIHVLCIIISTSMASNGLPNILNTMLDTLLAENIVISWNIRGEKDYTQLSIRFGNGKEGAVNDIAYRKAPPSRVTRDKQRQYNWKMGNMHCDDSNNKIQDDLNKQYRHTENNDIGNQTEVDQGLSPILTTTVDMKSNVGLDTGDQQAVGKSSDQVGHGTTGQSNIDAANVNITMKTRKVPLEVNMDTETTPFECDSCCEEVTDAE